MLPTGAAGAAAKMKLLGSAVLFVAGAAIMASNDLLPMTFGPTTTGGAQRRLQEGAVAPLRRLAATDYGSVSNGYCDGTGFNSGVASPSPEDCSTKCDADGNCVAFEYDSDYATATSGPFLPCVLYSTYDPANFEAYAQATCYVKNSYLDSINEPYGSVLGDPLFTGFRGQVLHNVN